jgi:hypothetical protein
VGALVFAALQWASSFVFAARRLRCRTLNSVAILAQGRSLEHSRLAWNGRPVRVNAMADLLVLSLHARLVREIAKNQAQHFEGLGAAARHLRRRGFIDSRLQRKLLGVETAYNVSRHITEASADELCCRLSSHLLGHVSAAAEHRLAMNGRAYTYDEFSGYYGDEAARFWALAPMQVQQVLKPVPFAVTAAVPAVEASDPDSYVQSKPVAEFSAGPIAEVLEPMEVHDDVVQPLQGVWPLAPCFNAEPPDVPMMASGSAATLKSRATNIVDSGISRGKGLVARTMSKAPAMPATPLAGPPRDDTRMSGLTEAIIALGLTDGFRHGSEAVQKNMISKVKREFRQAS